MVNFCKAFLLVSFFSFSCLAQENEKLKKIEFGFNIHYLNTAEKNAKAFEQIQADNFSKIRAFEPFTDSLSVILSLLINKIKFIQNYDFELLLSLSNFIWQPDLDITKKNISESNPKFINEALKYTNRFPPDDEEAFKLFLKTVMDSLQRNDCLKTMRFEIGNEPDADRYFWGNAEDWKKVVALISDVLKSYNVSFACCGFSSDLIFLKPDERAQFIDYVNSTEFPANADFSYHLYLETFMGKAETDNPRTSKVKAGIITEFGPASSLNAEKKELMNSPDVIHSLVQLLEFAYANDVETAYLFPLMDNKKNNTQMGYFDSEGSPKKSYNYLLLLRDVIKNGYSVFKTKYYTEIRGKETILRLAKSFQEMKKKKADIISCSCKQEKKLVLNKGEWLIYRR